MLTITSAQVLCFSTSASYRTVAQFQLLVALCVGVSMDVAGGTVQLVIVIEATGAWGRGRGEARGLVGVFP